MADLILVTGGARSGKSAYAQQLAESLPAPRAFVATCPVIDDEMRGRIELHQRAREGRGWATIEEPLDLAAVFRTRREYRVLLVDCVTLWINNLLYEAQRRGALPREADIARQCGSMLEAAQQSPASVIFVTNEVGMGIVPGDAASRLYRDLVGRANQLIGGSAQRVVLVSCGIPLTLKEKR
jgi:adenosylcobinamide kinase / adenosylcobinamide-phosphate guanylyltransferase